MDKPKLAGCSPEEIIKALNKLGGFSIDASGAKHIVVRHPKLERPFTIPRRNPVNRHMIKDLVTNILVKRIGFSEDQVYEHIDC